jgi:cysteine-rich repeat protein
MFCPAGDCLGVGRGICGDGVLTPDEACDDGNQLDADGCAADCLTVELGYFLQSARGELPRGSAVRRRQPRLQ